MLARWIRDRLLPKLISGELRVSGESGWAHWNTDGHGRKHGQTQTIWMEG